MANTRGSRLFGGFCRRLEQSPFLRPLEEKGRLERCAVALASFSAAFLVRETLWLFFPHVVRYVLYFPAVLAAALYGGVGSGLLCLALSAAALLLVAGRSLDAADLLNVALFAGTAAAIVVFVEALHRARASLRGAHRRLSEILDSGSEAFYALDREWRFTDVNRVAEGYWGRRREDLLGKVIWEAFPEAVGSPSHRAHLAAASERRTVELETVSPVLRRPIEARIQPFSGGLSVFFRDITAQREAERLRAQLEAVFQSMTDGVAVFDPEGTAVYINEADARLFGFAAPAELRRPRAFFFETFELSSPEGRPLSPEEWPLSRIMRGESLSSLELWVARRDTGQRWCVSFSGQPVYGRNKELVLSVVICRDVTERERFEERLELANAFLEERVAERTEELRRTVDELEAFAYTVAHDLRAPLRTVHRFADLLSGAGGGPPAASAREYLQRMTGAVKMMDLLIEDLLAYSRIGRARTNPEPVDVGALAREVASSLAGEIHDSGARVELPGEGSPRVLADRLLLSQALTNLLANALKFMPPGRRPEVTVGAEAHDGHARLWVQDNGIGIEPRYRDRVFKVFERLHGPEQYPGTGIGLAIVSRAVERMGGKVWFDSEPGKGSRFWVDLKLAPRKG